VARKYRRVVSFLYGDGKVKYREKKKVLGLHGDSLPAMAMNTADGRVLTYDEVWETHIFWAILYLKWSFYQDRLGTDIGKGLKKRTRFSQEDFSELALESWCGIVWRVFSAPFCTMLKVTEYLTKTGSGQAMGGTPQKDTFLQDTALSRRRCGRKDKGEKKKKRMRMPLWSTVFFFFFFSVGCYENNL
jgi:hypothetical protein